MTGGAAPSLEGPGHDEAQWRRWSATRTWPALDLPVAGRVLVVAPHPDDAVLAVGGLLKLLAARGLGIDLLAVTDGEGSHPCSPTVTPGQLRMRRVAESREAFRRLGVALGREERLGLPDGDVAGHETHLLAAVTAALGAHSHVMAPWFHDGHPDHDATGRAVRAALDRQIHATAWFYPVWAWHWARPDQLRRRWTRAARVDLPEDVRAVKRHAVAAHRSQVLPLSPAPGDGAIVPPHVRMRFERPWETVLR